ncbi:MAG: methyltransferase domain-containing protein [Mycobacteriaceae bacterium]
MLALPRYGLLARFYDVLSGERPVYRAGRVAGVAALQLQPGQRVLDLGCGTGLNFPLLLEGVAGRTDRGAVVGIDTSDAMLTRARDKVSQHGWAGVQLVHADTVSGAAELTGPFDAALFTYALSVIGDWQAAWAAALERVRPGGRMLVVDMALPVGRWRVLSPLARLACLTGGSDPHRHPWTLAERDLRDVTHQVLRGGHVHVVSGVKP